MNARTAGGLPLAGYIYMTLAALGFSFKSIWIKMAYRYGVEPITLLLMRMQLSAGFFVLALLWLRQREKRQIRLTPGAHGSSGAHSVNAGTLAVELVEPFSFFEKKVWLRPELRAVTIRRAITLVLMGVLGIGGATYFSLESIHRLEASLATLIVFIYPAITVGILAISQRRIDMGQLLALGIAFTGLILILRVDRLDVFTGVINPVGVMFGLASATCFAMYNVIGERVLRTLHPIRTAGYTVLSFTILISLVFGFREYPEQTEVWLLALALASISGFFPFILFMYGIRRIGAGPGTIINMSGPAFNSVWAYLLLQETRDWVQLTGIVLILFGIMSLKLKLPQLALRMYGWRHAFFGGLRRWSEPEVGMSRPYSGMFRSLSSGARVKHRL
ncbi:MAG: EamA family transporter [Leptospiraceae bacterium]|nr:EamA family transporter [Leptospiraceae bacterium]MCB1321217.1 EamA family transporter [Leptospiraceae bacterium]